MSAAVRLSPKACTLLADLVTKRDQANEEIARFVTAAAAVLGIGEGWVFDLTVGEFRPEPVETPYGSEAPAPETPRD